MIVETSTLVAIIRNEPERAAFLQKIEEHAAPKMSAANYLETGIVVDANRDPRLSRTVDALIKGLAIEVTPVTHEQAKIARQAYRDFGKGSGHRAQLNFGDCFAYALAVDTGEPLLYKGEDFAHTGIRRAVAGP